MPAFNEKNSITQTIHKVLQLNFLHELIIVDDCSTDGTRELLETINDPRVVLIFHAKNQGKDTIEQSLPIPH